jgi:hypothetical protein
MLLKDMEDQHFLIGLQLNFALCENALHESWGIWGRGKLAGIHGFWFGGFGLSSSYEHRRFAARHCYRAWLSCSFFAMA